MPHGLPLSKASRTPGRPSLVNELWEQKPGLGHFANGPMARLGGANY
jgi:hypothetical protein